MSTVKKALKAFLRSRQAAGLSGASLTWYERALKAFVDNAGHIKMKDIDAGLIERYILKLQKRRTRYKGAAQKPEQEGGLKPESIRNYVRALRVFVNWYWNMRGWPPYSNPMRGIKSPPVPDPEPSAVQQGDVIKMLEACGDDAQGRRNRAMISFLAETGCRAGGMLSLTMDSLDLTHERARLREKGQRTRYVTLSGYALWAMREWLAVRPPEAEAVFCALVPARYGNALTSAGLHYALHKEARKAGVEGAIHPHAFRHGFGIHLSLQGVSLGAVSKMMGHRSVNITSDYYLRFNQNELAELHRQASPLKDLEHPK